MSVLVMGHCFRIRFGSPQLKAVAIALADHAEHDGTKVYPSVKVLAEKTELCERTVQYKLRELESCGLLVLVEEGGHGPRSTREYKFDMDLLRRLAEGDLELVEEKGASDAPYRVLRVQEVHRRVQATTEKGASDAPEPSYNRQEPIYARARAKDEKPDLGKNGSQRQPARSAIDITSADSRWQDWIDCLERHGYAHLAERARVAGKMRVPSRWPPTGPPGVLPIIPPTKMNFLDRLLGEAQR